MRLLIVGEDYGDTSPSLRSPEHALSGDSGRRLAAMIGVPLADFLESTDRMNVVDTPDEWGDKQRVQWGLVQVVGAMRDRDVILLGGKVSRALGIYIPRFEWSARAGSRIAVMPHPSGRNRFWNDPDNVEKAEAFLREAYFARSET
jgi:uracil-DNA glycosylase